MPRSDTALSADLTRYIRGRSFALSLGVVARDDAEVIAKAYAEVVALIEVRLTLLARGRWVQ